MEPLRPSRSYVHSRKHEARSHASETAHGSISTTLRPQRTSAARTPVESSQGGSVRPFGWSAWSLAGGFLNEPEPSGWPLRVKIPSWEPPSKTVRASLPSSLARNEARLLQGSWNNAKNISPARNRTFCDECVFSKGAQQAIPGIPRIRYNSPNRLPTPTGTDVKAESFAVHRPCRRLV